MLRRMIEKRGLASSISPKSKKSRQGDVLKIISWNVAGLRALVKKNKSVFDTLVEQHEPDVICLQETKLQNVHVDGFKNLIRGYKSVFSCSTEKKGYSGTAMFVKKDLDGQISDDGNTEGRSITLKLPYVNLIMLYVPNSGMKLVRLDYRTETWDKNLIERVKMISQETGVPTIVGGDMNVAHKDIDLYNPKAKHIPKQAGCTTQERNSFTNILNSCEFVDSFRHLYPEKGDKYTYWSQRAKNRPDNKGLRLDYFLVPNQMKDQIVESEVLDQIMGSDHCPVKLTMKINE